MGEKRSTYCPQRIPEAAEKKINIRWNMEKSTKGAERGHQITKRVTESCGDRFFKEQGAKIIVATTTYWKGNCCDSKKKFRKKGRGFLPNTMRGALDKT